MNNHNWKEEPIPNRLLLSVKKIEVCAHPDCMCIKFTNKQDTVWYHNSGIKSIYEPKCVKNDK